MAVGVTTKPDQVKAVTEGAGVLDRSERGMIEVSGRDAVEYLQGQLTNDVAALSVGEGCYAALLTPKGRIVSDARVLVIAEDELWLDTEPSGLEPALTELRMYKIGRELELADRSGERALTAVIGPRADEIVAATCKLELLPGAEHASVAGEIGAQRVLVVRTETGLDLFSEASARDAIAATLSGAGATPVDEPAAEVVRVEHGLPRFGVDMTVDNLPGEAGITNRAVSFIKGCYVGQEPVARMFHKGHPNRMLRGLRLSAPVAAGAALMLEGKNVGTLSSVADSPSHGSIGLAIVRREASCGDVLVVEGSDARATVVELPFGSATASS